MKKDFQKWHFKKELIDGTGKRLFFHEREIWWCAVGLNIGFEQDGRGERFARPVPVFKKFNNEVFWAIPISTKIKKGKFYVPIEFGDGVARVAIISQLCLVDAKRLMNKIGTIANNNHELIQKAVISLCDS